MYLRSGFSFRGNMRTHPRSGFRSGGTSECTLVPVFVPEEHPPKPPFCEPPPKGVLQVGHASNTLLRRVLRLVFAAIASWKGL